MNKNEFLETCFRLFDSYIDKEGDRVVDYKEPRDLQEYLEETIKEGDYESLVTFIEQYQDLCVKTNHPQYFNQLWSGLSVPAIAGEMLASVCNTSMYTYEVAPVATLIEKQAITELLEVIGFKDGEGQMTTGGSNGNMIAMMIARDKFLKDQKTQGLFGQKPLVAFVSEEAHYSYDKAASILGIGLDNLIAVPVDREGSMDPQLLEQEIDKALKQGRVPFFVGATVGTTVRGAFDKVDDLRRIAHENDLWMHVDGAWGGAMMFSKNRDRYLKGLEKVDSYVWDAHKMMGVPLMCSFVFTREKGWFGRTCDLGNTSYIFHQEEEESFDLGPNSLQCGRRVDILKFWFDWKFSGGFEGYRQRVSHFESLIAYSHTKVEEIPSLKLLNSCNDINICFQIERKGVDTQTLTKDIRDQMHRSGSSFVNCGFLEGQRVIRLVLSNSETTTKDLDLFFKNLIVALNSYDG